MPRNATVRRCLACGLAAAAAASSGAQPVEPDGVDLPPSRRLDGSIADDAAPGAAGHAVRNRVPVSALMLPGRGRAGFYRAGTRPGGATTAPTSSEGPQGAMSLSVPLRAAAPDATGMRLLLKFRSHAGAAGRGPGSLGTDYEAQLKFVRPLGDWSAFGHLAYHGSDVPASGAYREPWRAGIGGMRGFGEGHEAGASVEYRQPAGGWAPVRELSAFAALRAGEWRYQLSMTRSLAQGSPDMSVGVSVRRRF
jgi:hypothetical protein